MEHTQFASDVQRLTESLEQFPEPVVKPAFIVVSGLPGTGKSYFCNQLAQRLPLVILESDALRKVLFPSPNYGPPESAHLFQTIHRLIERLLKRGIPPILDATNLSEREREHLYRIADRLDTKLILVRVEAPPEVVQERLKARQEEVNLVNKSDADWTVYQKMKSSTEKMTRNHYVVDTSKDIRSAIDKIVREFYR